MNIAHSFRTLPFPQPIRANDPLSYFPEMMRENKAPRMIPVFACCAMQSSYALIMLSYKTKAMGFASNLNGGGLTMVNGVLNGDGGNGKGESAMKLLGQLSEGLQMILGAIKNYSVAYEALGGMSGTVFSLFYFFALLSFLERVRLIANLFLFSANRNCSAVN